ncbi:hypothetical protein D3C72_1326280 [compost metagenome]
MGAALGLLVFPLFRQQYGLETTFLILSVVPLVASLICFTIKWDPTRASVSPDNEPDAPQFEADAVKVVAAR